MKFYIATVWTLSATAEAVDGDAGIQRNIVRAGAANPIEFRRGLEINYMDRSGGHVDDQIWVGPVSLSRIQ